MADEASDLQVLKAFEPCTNIAFVDSTTLTAKVPAGLPLGTHNLYVVNPSGEKAILYNSFTVTEGDGDETRRDGDGGGGGGGG